MIGRPRVPRIPYLSVTIGRLRKLDPAALPVTKPITRSQSLARNNLVSEPSSDMADQRLERLEKELNSLSAGQQLMEERITKRMEEMMAAFHIQTQNFHANASSSKNKGTKTYATKTNSEFVTPKLAKLSFPRYDGSEDPTS